MRYIVLGNKRHNCGTAMGMYDNNNIDSSVERMQMQAYHMPAKPRTRLISWTSNI